LHPGPELVQSRQRLEHGVPLSRTCRIIPVWKPVSGSLEGASTMIRITLMSLLVVTPASAESVPRILDQKSEAVMRCTSTDTGSVCQWEPRRVEENPSPPTYCAPQNMRVLEQEPPAGSLAAGARVYVHDARCPQGQIREITGGSNIGPDGEIIQSGSLRQRRCVKLPAPYRCPA
jgi:hypothetical protein